MRFSHSFPISVLISFQIAFPTAALAAASGETVRVSPTKAAPVATGEPNTPTPEEMKMGAVKSPYKACEKVVTVEKPSDVSKWKEQEAFWKKYPGDGTCDDKKVDCTRKVQFIPDVHFYKSFEGRKGPNLSGNENASDFLKRVGAKSLEKTNARIKSFEERKKCFDSGSADCAKSNEARLATLRAAMPEFRLIVARLLEKSPGLLSIDGFVPTSGEQLLNTNMSAASQSLIVPEKMPALNSKEASKIEAELNAFLKSSLASRDADIETYIKEQKLTGEDADRKRQQMRDPRSYGPRLKEEFAKKRKENTEAYVKMLKEFPELAYVNEGDLNGPGMVAKLNKMIEDANETKKSIEEAIRFTKPSVGVAVDKKLMTLAAHTDTIEEMLAAEGDGRSCAVANATFNELATIRTKDGLVIGGLTVGLSLGAGIWGMLKGKAAGAATAAGLTSEAGVLTGQAMWLGRMAWAAGAVGGSFGSVKDYSESSDKVRDARVGVVKIEDGREALGQEQLGAVMSLLNFQGAGAVFSGLAVGTAGWGLTKLGLASKFKDAGTGGGKAAAEMGGKLVAAGKGDKDALKAMVAEGEAAGKALLGHAPSKDETVAIDAIVGSGLAGDAKNPSAAAVVSLGEATKGLPATDVKRVADNAATIAKGIGKADLGDAERVAAVGQALGAAARELPDSSTFVAMAKDTKSWDAAAISGWARVVEAMKKFKGTAEQRFKQAWEETVASVKGAKDTLMAKWKDTCACGGICPIAKAASNDLFETTSEPRYMACTAP